MRLIFLAPLLVAFLMFFSCDAVLAHPGHVHPVEEIDEFEDEAFLSALAHPFTGVDHLLAMAGLGALAAAVGRGTIPAFVGAVGAGFASGLASPPWLPALSLVVVGGLLWAGSPGLKSVGWMGIALTGFLHGAAHAGGMSGIVAGAGLCAGTLAGVVLAAMMVRGAGTVPLAAHRSAGIAMACVGLLLAVVRLSQGQ